jgi:hypothetical protein
MSQATQNHTPPTRRGALQFSAAALFAGLAMPALAIAAEPDVQLIRLCNQLLATETELWLLVEHDEHAPDFGPNSAHYDRLIVERDRLKELVDECQHPVSAAGTVAIARVALTGVERDSEGAAMCDHFGEEMMLRLAEGVAAGFVWPPRPGSCSTAHWSAPASPKEIAEHRAARRAHMAQIDAEIQAKKLVEAAERRRIDAPSLMTNDELRGQMGSSRWLMASANEINAKLSAEMARRGLEVA